MGERFRELSFLLLGDLCVLVFSLFLTLSIRYQSWPTQSLIDAHLGPFLLLSTLWVAVFYLAGLYDKHTVIFKTNLFNRIVKAQIFNIALGALIFFLFPFAIAPKTNLVIYLLVSVVLISAWRIVLYPYVVPRTRKRALLIGSGEDVEELYNEVNHNDRYTYRFAGRLSVSDLDKVDLLSYLQDQKIDFLIVETNEINNPDILATLFTLSFEEYTIPVFDFTRVYENTFDRLPLTVMRYEWFFDNIAHSKKHFLHSFKRIFDLLGAIILGVIFLVALPFIALAIRIESRGPIFITQKRLGQYRKPINVFKLRTMTENRAASDTWTNEDQKQGNRVTKVGAFLRTTSLDEVPQMWNILVGEMSLIGPRSDIAGLGQRATEEIPFYAIRYMAKPGISGWAQTHQIYSDGQISPQSVDETKIRLAYDLFYVKNQSIFLEWEIFVRTIGTLVRRFATLFSFSR